MLINSVIIILREVFEAALIVSVLLVLCQKLQLPRRYFLSSLSLGGVLSIVYARHIAFVSMLFDGVGQEILNAGLHLMTFICLLFLIFSMGRRSYYKITVWAIIGCLSAALVREGSEIIIYIHGFIGDEQLLETVVAGSFIGAGVGFSVGVFMYYLMVNLSPRKGVAVSLIILVLSCASMITQALQLLIQADIVISQMPLWDSSTWVSEGSVTGQILYALLGYESTPTPIQVGGYFLSLMLSSALAFKTFKAFKWEMDE